MADNYKQKNRVILICGVPGTGKSTIASALGSILKCDQVISTDSVREVIRSMQSPVQNPILFSTTHESWRFFGDKTEENIIRGVKAHSRAIYPQIFHLVKKAAEEGRDIILEGVHLIPEIASFLNSAGIETEYFLLCLSSKEEHFRRFDMKNKVRTKFHSAWYSNFECIEIVNDWLLDEAEKRDMEVIENARLEESIARIVSSMEKNEILSL